MKYGNKIFSNIWRELNYRVLLFVVGLTTNVKSIDPIFPGSRVLQVSVDLADRKEVWANR